jgi:phosphoribosylaminoimidazolecarboxamide formyltransferase/IMP cyclohydrolase
MNSTDDTASRPVRTALLSAWDKTGIAELARAIAERGGRLLASGGTAAKLREAALDVTTIEEYAGLAAGFGGRVKTLHPKVHAGILARRDVPEDLEELERGGALPIDLVCVNLYPFEDAVAAGRSEAERTEMIDIGGPAMIRAAAKNWEHVTVVSDAADIPDVVRELAENGGAVTRATRRRLARAAFARTCAYDAAIAADLGGGEGLPPTTGVALTRVAALRYGENPHQSAGLYTTKRPAEGELPAGWRQLAGKALSYNNWIDLVAAADLAFALDGAPAAVVVKHTNPCGAAHAKTQPAAWERALAGDPVSAFGGIAAFNRSLSEETARALTSVFLEVVVAPEITDGARAALAKKKNLRLVEAPVEAFRAPRIEWRTLPGGAFLLQDGPGRPERTDDWKVVSKRAPTAAEMRDLEFAWKVCASVKSNAIVFARDEQVLGVGAGQMSRVDSVRIAAEKAAEHGHDLAGSVVGSDAFFPFADGPKRALEAGAVAIVQPGGSKRDAETLEAVDAAGAAMVYTGRRVFRH